MAVINTPHPVTHSSIRPAFNLWWGIVGCIAIMVGIYLLGPYNYDYTFEAKPEGHPMWYLWQLENPTFMSRASAWGGYFLHQISIWWLIYLAQTQRLNYEKKLHPINILAISANVFFVALHVLQTKVWYDGLAQDVPEWTSVASVVVFLIAVLIIENPRRGLVFGKKAPGLISVGQVLRKYHGYYFAWAFIYTFWYHPIELTSGHLLGILYTLLLLLQGSLMFTQFHRNKYWTVLLETFVVVHAILVAYFTITANGSFGDTGARFVFGLVGVFVITQMHGLGLSLLSRWLIFGIFCFVLGFYYYDEVPNIKDAFMIPIGNYLGVALLAAIIWLIAIAPKRLIGKIRKGKSNNLAN